MPETRFFCHFIKFGALFFLGIEYNDSLQQFLTSSRCKIHEKSFGAQIWAKGSKIRPEITFFAILSSLVKFGSLVFLEIE